MSRYSRADQKAIEVFGIGTVAGGATGGFGLYYTGALAGSGITTLGVAGGPSVLTAMSSTDAAVISLAIDEGASATAPFMEDVSRVAEALNKVVPGAKVNYLGQLEGSPIYGSLRSGIGIVAQEWDDLHS